MRQSLTYTVLWFVSVIRRPSCLSCPFCPGVSEQHKQISDSLTSIILFLLPLTGPKFRKTAHLAALNRAQADIAFYLQRNGQCCKAQDLCSFHQCLKRCSQQSVLKPPAHSVLEEPCSLVTSTREETFTPGTEISHPLSHSVKAWYRVIQPRTPSSSICTLTCMSVHIINSASGTASVKSTLEHYHPIFNRTFSSPKGKSQTKSGLITPGAPSLSSDLQGSWADLPGHSRNCHRGPHSHSC